MNNIKNCLILSVYICQSLGHAYHLHEAVKRGNVQEIQYLLSQGYDPEVKDEYGESNLLLAASRMQKNMMILLLNNGARIDGKDIYYKRSIFAWSSIFGYTELVSLWANSYPQFIEEEDVDGRTPLLLAAINDKIEVAKVLLKHGAKIEHKDSEGNTPLIWAAQLGFKKMVEILLESGAKIEAKDNEGKSPLFWAKNLEFTGIVEMLEGRTLGKSL